jgi:hypothetical protein
MTNRLEFLLKRWKLTFFEKAITKNFYLPLLVGELMMARMEGFNHIWILVAGY